MRWTTSKFWVVILLGVFCLSCAYPSERRSPPSPAGMEPQETETEASGEVGEAMGEAGEEAMGEDEENYTIVQVFYATDRKPTGVAEAAGFFGGDRGELSYGLCRVSIPRDHRMGEVERPSIWRLEFREDPERHVVLHAVVPEDPDTFFDRLRARVGRSEAREAFVFVHGYNVGFADAARRTAQITYDLGFEGAPIFYSWPSKGQPAAYPRDETNIQYTQPHLKRFLREVATRSGAETIHLIAHSMGNRGLTRALVELTAEGGAAVRSRFHQIVLAAPDIDAEVFRRDIAPKLVAEDSRVTLYASSRDRALLASREFHDYPRAGEAGDSLVPIEGIDIVDASKIETDFLGHSYFADSGSVISDLVCLLFGNRAPGERGLVPVETPHGIFWRFLPSRPFDRAACRIR
jgi:esterase/lipase superfamily enzyme